jgi:hypothetical protein
MTAGGRPSRRTVDQIQQVTEIPMTNAMTDIALNAQEESLTFDVSDEALEIAATAPSGQANFTLAACTGLSACPA